MCACVSGDSAIMYTVLMFFLLMMLSILTIPLNKDGKGINKNQNKGERFVLQLDYDSI